MGNTVHVLYIPGCLQERAPKMGSMPTTTLLLPGFDRRWREPFAASIPDAIADLLSHIDAEILSGDFILWGMDIGALLAFECASQISKKYQKEPLALWVTGWRPPHFPSHLSLQDDPLSFLLQYQYLDQDFPTELLHCYVMQIQTLFRWEQTYLSQEVLSCPIVALRQDSSCSLEAVAGWSACTSETFYFHVIDTRLPQEELFNLYQAKTHPQIRDTEASEQKQRRTVRKRPSEGGGL